MGHPKGAEATQPNAETRDPPSQDPRDHREFYLTHFPHFVKRLLRQLHFFQCCWSTYIWMYCLHPFKQQVLWINSTYPLNVDVRRSPFWKSLAVNEATAWQSKHLEYIICEQGWTYGEWPFWSCHSVLHGHLIWMSHQKQQAKKQQLISSVWCRT